MRGFEVRLATDADSPRVVELVDSAYQQYPNCILDVDLEEPELRAVSSSFRRKGGEFWVAVPTAVASGRSLSSAVRSARSWPVLGSIAVRPVSGSADVWELKKMYVAREARRMGVASELLRVTEQWLIRRGMVELQLWTDSRFIEAHGFYQARGFQRRPGERQLQDLSDTTEYPFFKRRESLPMSKSP